MQHYTYKYAQQILRIGFLSLIISFNIFAQEKSIPFNTITLLANGTYSISDNISESNWESDFGFKLYAETPFYFGEIGLGIAFMPYKAEQNLPNINIANIMLGWGSIIKLNDKISFFVGINMGAAFFNIESNELTQYERSESELSFGSNLRVVYNITSNIGINTEVSVNKIFTHYNLKQSSVGMGLQYTFETSNWIRDFLN